MAILDIISALLAFIDNSFLGAKILRIGFLKQHVACIFFVMENPKDTSFTPFTRTTNGRYAHFIELFSNGKTSHTGQIIVKNHADNLCFFRNYRKLAILQIVSKHTTRIRSSFREHFLNSPFLVFTSRASLLFCIHCKERKHQFAIRTETVEILFFKEYVNIQ